MARNTAIAQKGTTTTATTSKLCITPRAALLTIVADPALEDAYRVTWDGAVPSVREHGHAIEVDYTIAGRVRALSTRSGSLTVALHPSVAWSIELRGGVSGLRADLRDLRVCELAIGGGARDVVVDLPQPSGELVLSIAGGLSKGVVRRPAATPVSVEIDGGATNLRLDDTEFGAIGDVVRQRTSADTNADGVVELRVFGGASGLTVSASERTGREQR
ncbi:MAG: hypothetical protein QOF69_193 [Solirubrobacteraceae bacterium]|nr:hypothetical protein [Solirubrobacteraceae bacterium]